MCGDQTLKDLTFKVEMRYRKSFLQLMNMLIAGLEGHTVVFLMVTSFFPSITSGIRTILCLIMVPANLRPINCSLVWTSAKHKGRWK